VVTSLRLRSSADIVKGHRKIKYERSKISKLRVTATLPNPSVSLFCFVDSPQPQSRWISLRAGLALALLWQISRDHTAIKKNKKDQTQVGSDLQIPSFAKIWCSLTQ
jgi:hypothetical protein